MVAGAAQAYQQYSQGEQRRAQLSAQTARSWSVVTDRWNALVGEFLPVLAHVVTDNLLQPRWQAARLIAERLRAAPAEHRPAAVRAVAHRRARLDVLRRYPAAGADGPRRGEIAARLRSARDATTTPRFLDF